MPSLCLALRKCSNDQKQQSRGVRSDAYGGWNKTFQPNDLFPCVFVLPSEVLKCHIGH